MKMKFSAIYLIFSILFFLGLIAWLGIGIYAARGSAQNSCEKQFGSLKDSIAASYLIESRFDSPYFLSLMKRTLSSQPRLRALVISSNSGGVEYVYAADDSYLAHALPPYAENAAAPFPAFDSWKEILLTASVFVPSAPGISVQAVYGVYSHQDTISLLKGILIAVILFLILTAVILILFSLRDTDSARTRHQEPFPAGEPARSTEAAPVPEAPKSAAPAASPGPEPESASTPEPAIPPAAAAEALHVPESEAPSETAPDQIPEASASGSENQTGAEMTPREQVEPVHPSDACAHEGGLFSPRSDLGWESYLEQRLDSELKRAASFDQDLSCVAFSCQKGCTDSDYRKVAQRILETFMYQDLAFEQGTDGFVVILPNIDLDQAVGKVEVFIDGLEKVPGIVVHAGISSRNGRLMRANLLLKEALRGLEKARTEGENRIVAFRTDPARYRQFLASKS